MRLARTLMYIAGVPVIVTPEAQFDTGRPVSV